MSPVVFGPESSCWAPLVNDNSGERSLLLMSEYFHIYFVSSLHIDPQNERCICITISTIILCFTYVTCLGPTKGSPSRGFTLLSQSFLLQ